MLIFIAGLEQEEKNLVIRLYKKLNIPMYKIALNILKNREDAEEAVANSFIKIMEGIEKISKISCPQMEAYCVSILKNESINILRREKKYLLTEEIEDYQLQKTISPVEEEVTQKVQQEILIKILEELEEEDQLLVIYHYVDQMTYKDIAKLLGITEEAAKKRGQRILKKLKDKYKGGGYSER